MLANGASISMTFHLFSWVIIVRERHSIIMYKNVQTKYNYTGNIGSEDKSVCWYKICTGLSQWISTAVNLGSILELTAR